MSYLVKWLFTYAYYLFEDADEETMQQIRDLLPTEDD